MSDALDPYIAFDISMYRVTEFLTFANPYNSYSTNRHTLVLVFEKSGFYIKISYSYREIEYSKVDPYYLAHISREQAYVALDKAVAMSAIRRQ